MITRSADQTCDVCGGPLPYEDNVIGGRLHLPVLYDGHRKIRHAHLGCYRLFGEYGLKRRPVRIIK